MSRVYAKTVEFIQTKTVPQLMDEYRFPPEVRELKLKHGESLINADLLYEIVSQGATDDVFRSMKQSNQTFYRNDVYFALSRNQEFTDVTSELELVNTESKPLNGPKCPRCKGTNTTIMTNQDRGCDEGYTTYLVCYKCGEQTKNPRELVYSDEESEN